MRVASAGLYRQVLDAIGRNQSDVARLQLQVATGRRMLAPADDPSGSVRSMHLRNAIDQLAQFQANGARAAAAVWCPCICPPRKEALLFSARGERVERAF